MSNSYLKQLHFERLERNKQKTQEIGVQTDLPPEFTCAVCYTNGEDSGLVSPACCSHKICLSCYTNIVIINKKESKCPECRALFVSEAKEQEQEQDQDQDEMYSDMPPLISSEEALNIQVYYTLNRIMHIMNTVNIY